MPLDDGADSAGYRIPAAPPPRRLGNRPAVLGTAAVAAVAVGAVVGYLIRPAKEPTKDAAPAADSTAATVAPVPAGVAVSPPVVDPDAVPADDPPGPARPTGSGFSTAIVSGVAALVRAKYPRLSARQVVTRLTRTARHPSGGVDDRVGFGMIDPVAALTADLPVGG